MKLKAQYLFHLPCKHLQGKDKALEAAHLVIETRGISMSIAPANYCFSVPKHPSYSPDLAPRISVYSLK